MNPKLKLAVYAVLIALVAWTGISFYSSYKNATKEIPDTTNTDVAQVTPAPVADTNAASTNIVPADGTNASTNAVVPTPAPPVPPKKAAVSASVKNKSNTFGFLAGFIGSVVILGLLLAYDFSQYAGSAAVDLLLEDGGEGSRDPEYERAEQIWANGKHLEAIQMMREFLKNNPRAQYASLRIAEIYEKDLGNHLAAALEYEEVLKRKLPDERWGWAAVHLCNLYSKLGQQDKLRALLQRVADEYPRTAAAKKARARLGLPEPDLEPTATAVASEESSIESAERYDLTDLQNDPQAPNAALPTEPSAPLPPPDEPKSNLPPGFRPKK